MGLIKWLFGMNLSEEDLEHNRQIDEAQKWLQNAHRYYEWKFGKRGTDKQAGAAYQEYLKETKIRAKQAQILYEQNEKKIYENKHQKIINFIESNENNARFKIINMKQKQNIPLTKDELEFMNNYNNKNLDNNNNPDSNDQNKSNLELQLAIKQKELELLKLRAQMEKEKN